jgi:hypothetical protein
MRRLLVMIAAGVFLPVALARPEAETYAPKDAGYSAKFPAKPSARVMKTRSPAGQIELKMADYTTQKGDLYGATYYDLPGGKIADPDVKELLTKIVNALKGDGKLVDSKDLEFGDLKLPGKSFTIDLGKQQFLRGFAVVRDERVYQVFVQGSKSFAEGKDAKAFLDSFTVTK